MSPVANTPSPLNKLDTTENRPWIKELELRGLLAESTDKEALSALPNGTKFYVGIDPSAPSLQVGNLVPLLVSIHLAKSGMHPVILFGGATGAIGDPSGKSAERNLISHEQVQENARKQTLQVKSLFSKLGLDQVSFVNNADWTEKLSIIDFLRDIGKHFPIGYLLSKEFIRSRVENEGITYTEFSYTLLQAMDFLHLYSHEDIKVQYGGSDQWGNITSGLELIRRKGLGPAHAFSFPLITKSDGKKFGKSEKGALWLDATMTEPYELHQFFLNQDDDRMSGLLHVFCLDSIDVITEILAQHAQNPGARTAQLHLADSLTKLIHGEESLTRIKQSSTALFQSDKSPEELSDSDILSLSGIQKYKIKRSELSDRTLSELLVDSQLTSSKGDAKRLIQAGGAYIFDKRVTDINEKVSEKQRSRSALLLRSGKKKYAIIQIEE